MKKSKSQKGITLIALVITIIILLILASISIAMLTGENGLITKAIKAKEETEINYYKEQIELTRNELKLQDENYASPTIYKMEEALKKKEWVNEAETGIIEDEGIEKLKLTTQEGYIFYITEKETEYKGKGEIVDTSDLKKEEAINLKIVRDGTKGKIVQITKVTEKEYYEIEYQIDSQEGEWTRIESGGEVDVAHSSTIHARLVYGSNKGVVVSLSIEASVPSVVAKNTDTSQIARKTTTPIADLFEITWGSDGQGKAQYSISGNWNFKNTPFNSTEVSSLSELEIGNYTITCKVISPSQKEATATKENVKVTKLANTTVTNASNNQVEANAIYNEYDLAYFRDMVNQGSITVNGKIMNDLNLTKVCGTTMGSWEPIGSTKYSGILDGGNQIIDYLYINSISDNQGLFGVIENASITGIVIGEHSSITGNAQVGGIVGNGTNSTIINCGNNANIIAKGNMGGGIIGRSTNVLINSAYNKGEIKGEVPRFYIGGISGYYTAPSSNVALISNSYNTGTVTGSYFVGGIVGDGDERASINNCYNTGKIIGQGGDNNRVSIFLGGISSRLRAYGEIRYCYNLGTITNNSQNIFVGGITGQVAAFNGVGEVFECSSKVEYSYNSGNVESKGAEVGGICGENTICSYIRNSYIANTTTVKYNGTSATANIGSASSYLGKIIGYNVAGSSNVTSVGVLSSMPTVYQVVNGLNEGESQYWSKSNENEPQLLWEN